MRELTMEEFSRVSGGTGECTAQQSGNNYGGITETSTLGQELIEIYEGVVEATSYVIERVASAL
jgi:hypothetical protein